MIERIYCIDGRGTNPYRNLGLEEYLLCHVREGECILYLWQNEKTVVIGRNQNAWKECRCGLLEADGGYLARRLSGGGAVFHDLGNLNFTFLTRKKEFDIVRQSDVILRAVKRLGIHGERTGRNDITVNGRKFSGNAFYESAEASCHHGTILLHADTEEMAKYLSVSKEKLKSKSVDSVKSRVANLSEFVPGITVQEMRECLTAGFCEGYGLPVEIYPPEFLDEKEVAGRTERFASWEWKYGKNIAFSDEAGFRFSWGEVLIQARVIKGLAAELAIWSDAIDSTFTGLLEECLVGVRWSRDAVGERLGTIPCENETQAEMKRDIGTLLSGMI